MSIIRETEGVFAKLKVRAVQEMLDSAIAFASEYSGVALLLVLCLLAVCAIALSQIAARRRRRELLAALESSSRGVLKMHPTRERGALATSLTPAPDPFAQFFVYFTMRPRPWPLGMLSRLFGGRSQRIEIRGVLRTRPLTEVTWQRGRPPERAIGRGYGTDLWTLRRVNVMPGEYAVRGVNEAGLQHLFMDVMTRYGAFAQKVLVQADRAPHVHLSLTANGLNAEDIPALVNTVTAIARAALR